MKYRFRKLDFWEELKAAVGDVPVNIKDTGEEILLDFGDVTLTPQQRIALINLMEQKPMLRGRLAKFVKEGVDIDTTPH